MLLFSEAKITVRRSVVTKVEGAWKPYHFKIREWLPKLCLGRATVSLRGGRIHFSSGISPDNKQRLRNFLFNECPAQ